VTEILLPHVEFARYVLRSGELDVPQAFIRRAQLAALPAVPSGSVVEVPAYLIDLGLRRWRDPATLFLGSLARQRELAEVWETLELRQPRAIAAVTRAWDKGARSSDEVTADLESLVIFTGDDVAATRFASLLSESVRPLDSARMTVALATVRSLEDPVDAGRLFELARDLCTTGLGRYMAELRRVALIIKRIRDYAEARALIQELQAEATSHGASWVLSEADTAGVHALLLNLRALIEVREDDLPTALATMEEAAAIMPDDGFVIVPGDMADRYRSQVRINVVQTLWLLGQVPQALQRINAHVTITRTEHPYSLSEALLVAAYFNFMGGEYGMALSYCMESERLIAAEGAPTRLAMCRRIAVGSLARMGKRRRADILAHQMVRDPLGDHRLV
jgi:hypothetical protein